MLVDTNTVQCFMPEALSFRLMPGFTEEEIARLEQAVAAMPPISALLDQGETPEGLLRWVVGE